MEFDQFTFQLILVFFPGVICALLVNAYTTHRPRTPFFFVVYSLVFGLASYAMFWLVASGLNWASAKLKHSSIKAISNPVASAISEDGTVNFEILVWATLCALAVAIFVTYISERKHHFKLAHKIGITKKFADLDVWGYLFNTESKYADWVTVRDHEHDLIFRGWVHAFSENSKDAELLLRDVSVYRNEDGEALYQVGAIYISRYRENITIELDNIPVHDDVKWIKENKNE